VFPYRRLKVWEKAHALVLRIYQVTARFPSAERYGLTAQLRRSTVSIAANIVEGCSRGGDKPLANHIEIGRGSANESEYYLLLAKDLDYIDGGTYGELTRNAQEIGRMLTGLQRTVRRRVNRSPILPS
jgi:four helix bundle protein